MRIEESVLFDAVEFLLALLLIFAESTAILKGWIIINAAVRPGWICPHQFGGGVLAVLLSPSATVPEKVPLVLISKFSTLFSCRY